MIGVLISIFSRNFGFMMLGRVLQACGNGVLMSAAQVIILTIYPAEKKGSMMGTSSVSPQKVADASSLLTSLRTVAGSIGSAVFVGIMTMVGDRSAAAYGDGALMHGMNVSFLWMAAGAAVLLLISVFMVKDGRGSKGAPLQVNRKG